MLKKINKVFIDMPMNDLSCAIPGNRHVVFISAYQDFRSKKKASIQHIAKGLVRQGYKVSFVSTRFSVLSKFNNDSRAFLWGNANQLERVDGVDCYLWRTWLHPFASRSRILNGAMNLLYPLYARKTHPHIDSIMEKADYVIVESGVAAIFLRHIRDINPRARIIYYATDRLDTVGAHPFVARRLLADAQLVDHVVMRSPKMASNLDWAAGRLYTVPFGVDTDELRTIGPSPYNARLNAVSVGSMLFDADFFRRVAPLFPEIQFHVIGADAAFDAPDNVRLYSEMPYRDTLPFVKHATIGLAPYRQTAGGEYLAESSLKMAQYALFGVPTVCPYFAVGASTSRSGYEPGDTESMRLAVSRALGLAGSLAPQHFPSWAAVAQRVLHPEQAVATVSGSQVSA